MAGPVSITGTQDDLAEMRRRLLRHLVALTLLTTGAVLAVTMILAARARAGVSEMLIDRATAKAEESLDGFFGAVSRNLLVGKAWGEAGALEPGQPLPLNERLVPVMVQNPQVSSLMVGDEGGREYLLLRVGGEWLNRLTDVDGRGNLTQWRRWSDGSGPVQEWDEELDYDPRKRPWFLGAMSIEPAGDVHWTDPYTFFTTKDPGITASVRWKPPGDDAKWHVLAFDVLLTDISRFTQELEISDRGKIVVLDSTGRVVGLPKDDRYRSPADLKQSVLQHIRKLNDAPVTEACLAWEAQGGGERKVWAYESMGERWWGGVRPYDLGGGKQFYIAAIVPESDLLGELSGQRNLIIVIALIALLVAITLAHVLNRAFRRKVTRAVDRARKLGQYTLEKRLGQGGMGAVYRARHAMLRRPTAVKLLRAEQAGSERALARFEREVQQTARLTHPNTIGIFDYGRTPAGVFYYAMEYLEGASLEDLVGAMGRIPASRVIHILLQVCGSLEEAHAAGLVHRDIKPANIMLCERGGVRDVVKVLDFGLVKSSDFDDAKDVKLTGEGAVAGTPLYLAPESITDPANMDGRGDLYALGAVAYFLLTAEPVFDEKTATALMLAHMNNEPVRPSERIHADLPHDLEDVILACLAKKPEDRPAGAAELADMLRTCASAGKWGRAEAAVWWEQNGTAVEAAMEVRRGVSSDAPGPLTIDLGSR